MRHLIFKKIESQKRPKASKYISQLISCLFAFADSISHFSNYDFSGLKYAFGSNLNLPKGIENKKDMIVVIRKYFGRHRHIVQFCPKRMYAASASFRVRAVWTGQREGGDMVEDSKIHKIPKPNHPTTKQLIH